MAQRRESGQFTVKHEKVITDHTMIRKLAEERGARPGRIKRAGSDDDIGILRIDFPGYSEEGSLEEISWDQFFEKFDEQGLSLIYQEQTLESGSPTLAELVTVQRTKSKGFSEKTDLKKKSQRRGTGGKLLTKKKGDSSRNKPSAAVSQDPNPKTAVVIKHSRENSEAALAEHYAAYTYLVARAVAVFGDDIEAARWLSAASRDFGDLTPLQSFSRRGPDHVLDILGKIEHGVFF